MQIFLVASLSLGPSESKLTQILHVKTFAFPETSNGLGCKQESGKFTKEYV
jgi:hypothetical protein